MPNVICFGRELPNVEFEFLHGLKKYALIVDGTFVAYFHGDTEPLAAYCDYLSHGRFERAELLSLRWQRAIDPEMALSYHFGVTP